MKKHILILAALGTLFMASSCQRPITVESNQHISMATSHSFYALEAKTLEGQKFSFESLRGKRVLIVNTASKCGYTPQYEDLQKLHETAGGEAFVILGFPSNDFGNQEPGTATDIKAFCSANYGVTFQMMEKVVTDAEKGHPVYQWLCQKELNGVADAVVGWNFNKFLIDENGNWTAYYPSRTKPMSAEILSFAQQK
ncbi:MAG: hypothetical protein RL754_253 [Bacteroidota bacterium]|jgi:glutathione peroxidase